MNNSNKARKPTVTEHIEFLIEQFRGEFMKPQILTRLTVSQIDNEHGESRWTEQGDENLEDGEQITATFENVSLCRLSASGYMDCTDWTLCHDENDIMDWLITEAEHLGPLWTIENTEFHDWFERDRQNVRLEDSEGNEIICLWDEAVTEFVEDGFKSRNQSWHEALVNYANEHSLTVKRDALNPLLG